MGPIERESNRRNSVLRTAYWHRPGKPRVIRSIAARQRFIVPIGTTRRSADILVCRFADFPVGCAVPRPFTIRIAQRPGRPGGLRNSRFGNLRKAVLRTAYWLRPRETRVFRTAAARREARPTMVL
jgi:hypothetical protein